MFSSCFSSLPYPNAIYEPIPFYNARTRTGSARGYLRLVCCLLRVSVPSNCFLWVVDAILPPHSEPLGIYTAGSICTPSKLWEPAILGSHPIRFDGNEHLESTGRILIDRKAREVRIPSLFVSYARLYLLRIMVGRLCHHPIHSRAARFPMHLPSHPRPLRHSRPQPWTSHPFLMI